MRILLKWALLATLCLLGSCARVEEDGETIYLKGKGVFGYITPPIEEDEVGLETKASMDPSTMRFSFEKGDRINIWSESGTTLFYKVMDVTDAGRAKFEGGGFTLTEGETYYSSFPLIRSTSDEFQSISITYEGQVQQADNEADHVANYSYSFASATCKNGNTSFTYGPINSRLRFYITLPEALTITELTITASDAVFALNGTQDITAGETGFTPGEMSNVMTLKLNDVEVTDGELNAFMAVAPCAASDFIIRLKATNGKTYTSPKISKGDLARNVTRNFRTEVFEGENPAVAKIGETAYMTLAEAVAAVPADGTETTITMIGDDKIDVVGSAITIAATKNIILDLNGHNVVGTAEQGSTSALITNKGNLTIMDSSDSKADGSGNGKLISGATTTWVYDGSGNYAGSYASNTITNTGTLTINSGYIENLSTGSATYAVDNNSSGADAILNVNGGVLKAHSVAVRQFANSNAKENTVNVAGGTLEAGYTGIWIQLPGSDATKAMKAKLNVTGGTLKGGSYAFYDYTYGNSFDATQYTLAGGVFEGGIFSYGANIDITDGTFNGDVAIKQAKPSTVSVSGGKFAGDVYTYGDNASEGFITGGIYAITTYEYEGNTYDCDWTYLLADGYMVAANTDEATMAAYPYTVAVDPTEYVAKISGKKYETLEAAFAAAKDGETITLLKDCAGNGIVAPQGKFGTTGLTVDFGGHTYTVDGSTVGSTGTETNGFQLLKDSKITFKNGIITSTKAKILIQNYSDLTLEGMTLTLNNANYAAAYTLSNNCGSVVINGSTINANPAGGFAFDVCRYASYPSVNVTVKGESVINGNIEIYASDSDAKEGFGLNVESGTITGELVMDSSAATAMVGTPEKAVITKNNGVTTLAAPANFKWVDNGNGTSTLKAVNYVAKIGDVMYETIAEAFAAATAGQTIEVIKAGEYTLPNMPNNVTVEGAVEGVVFSHTTTGSIASVPNGATFKNVTFNFGNVDYHGFQHAGTINMEGCTLNGRLTSYGDMNFTNCMFNQSNSDYHMWAYSGNMTYTGCTFTNTATGKFLNVYNEGLSTKYTVTATNCKFVNQASSANKAALNVKATCGAKLLAYDVIINNCTTEGAFPAASTSNSLVVLNALVQVDDRTADGVDYITVTQDGQKIYPATPAHIGSNSYATIQAAFDAAQDGDVITVDAGTYNEVVNVTGGKTVTIQATAGANVAVAGINHSSNGTPSTITVKNITVDNALQTEGWFTGTSQKINPCVGAWGGHFAFDGCTFKVSGAGKYETGIMTWWTVAKTTFDFDNCVFEASDAAGSNPSSARAMQIYGDVDMTVDGCTFATAKSYSLKYVGKEGCTAVFNNNTVSNSTCFVQLGSSSYAGTGYSISLNNTTYSGEIAPYLIDNEENQTVYIDGVKVYPADPVHIGSNSYATIQAAFDAAQDGDVITVDAGTYNEVVNVTGGKTVTIQATAGANVAVAGINHSSNGTPSTITVKNITVDNALQTEGWFTGTSPNINPCVGAWGGHFAFDGCTFKVSGAGKYETGIMTWWVTSTTTFDFDNCVFEPSDPDASSASEARAMQIYGNVNLTVDNCTFTTPKRYSLKYVGGENNNAVLRNNTVSNARYVVELGASTYPGRNYTTAFYNTTLNGDVTYYSVANEEGQTVFVDGVKVYPAEPDYETDANGNLSIYTAAGMQYFASQVNDSQVSYSGKTVTLMNDIDMTGIDWIPVGQTGGYGAKTYFQGTFDGNGKTISNLTVTHWEEGTNSGEFYASGLFGFIDAAGATVKNLTMDHANVTGSHWTAAIVGYLSGEISGCTVTNSSVVCTNKNKEANGDKAGLITGYINGTQGTVTNCTGSNSTVQAYRDAGQLVGAAKSTQVSGCTATNVTVTGTGGGNIRNEVIGRLL